MPILEVKNLRVVYGREEILSDISFYLNQGETLAVIGPNGSGKTTLFKAILNIIPYEGEVNINKDIRIGYVPQKLDIERDLPITVEEFLLLKKGMLGKYSQHLTHTVQEALDFVHLPVSFAKKKFSDLSSGELQRVMISWALIDHPDLLLFDEPTASVDVAGQETIYDLLDSLREQEKFTLLLISHDLTVVYRYATKVICLNKIQVCFGTPHEVLTTEELRKLYGEPKFYTHTHNS